MDANSACKVTGNPGKIRKTQMRILIKLSPEVIIRMKKLLSCCLKTASALPEIFQHLVRYDSIILRLYFIVHTSCPKFLFKRFKKTSRTFLSEAQNTWRDTKISLLLRCAYTPVINSLKEYQYTSMEHKLFYICFKVGVFHIKPYLFINQFRKELLTL